MPLSGTVAANKDQKPQGYRPVVLVSLQFLDGTFLYLSTMPLNPGEGGYTYGGNSYLARIISENFTITQARSEYGIDRIPAVTLKLADPDYFLWLSYEMNQNRGFCGAILACSLILMDISPSTGAYVFTSDDPLQFIGICDPPARENDGATMTLTAQSSHNMGKVYQPYVQVQQRCPWIFPVGSAQRLAGGTDPSSQFWFCGYDPDQAGTDPELGTDCRRGNTTSANLVIGGVPVTDASGIYIACDYTKSGPYGCQAHGMYAKDSNGLQTGRFGGEQWAPNDLESRSKSYTTGKQVTVFSAANTSIYTDRFPMLYGTQWVIPPIVLNELGDANSTRGEATICMGNIGISGVLQVVLNGIIVPRNNVGNPLGGGGIGIPGSAPTDSLQRWNFTGGGSFPFAYGSRNGAATADAGFNDSNGNPQGDPHGSHATIEWVVYSELLQSTSLPSMMILASGPAIWVYSNPTKRALQISNSPAWVLMDLLIRSNWSFAEFDIQSFITAAQVAFVNVSYVSLTGASEIHTRFRCELVIHQRRTAQEVIQMVLRSFNAQLVPNSTSGLLQLIVRQTLADQQPNPITGSNYNLPITSLPGNASQSVIDTYEAEGVTGSEGYVAWMFDESSIYRPSTPDGQGAPRLRIYTLPNLQRPNQLTFPFQDSDNTYAQDSLTLSDEQAINRAGGFGGAVQNTESYQVLGISNFDQAIRIANVYLAEQNHGNPEGDARGTYYFEIESTSRIEHLRVGNIVLVQNQTLNMNGATTLMSPPGTPIPGFLARVAAVNPTTDFERVTCTLSWHECVWYTDLFGQAPAPFYSLQARGIPARPPYAWSPYGQQPIVGDAMWPSSAWGFGVSQSYSLNADGTSICRVAIYGCPPVNKFATVLAPPLAAIQGTTAATGGSIAGNQSLYLMLSGVDVSGLLTPISKPCLVQILAGTNTNTASITGIFFPSGTQSWILYAGIDQQRFCEQAAGTGTPSSIQITSLNQSTYGAPDPLAAEIHFRWKREIHGGLWGAQASAVDAVGADTLTFTGAAFGPTGWAGRIVSKIANLAGSTSAIPLADYLVTSSSGDILTVTPDPAASGVQVGDVFEMRAQATTFSATTIGDSGFINGFALAGLSPGAEVGHRVRIIGGYNVQALNQERTIVSNTATVLTVDTPFDVVPNATSLFVILEAAWQGSYDAAYTCATPATLPAPLIATLDVTNYKSQTIFIEALVEDANGTTALEYFSPYRELYVWGSAGTSGGTVAPLSATYTGSVGNVGVAFIGQFNAFGGVGPYTFVATSGGLPPGLNLETAAGVPSSGLASGVIYGTPTTVETALQLVVQVTDSVGSHCTATAVITILPVGVGPFTDTVTGLSVTVVYKATAGGQYTFQATGSLTIPVITLSDSAFANVFAAIQPHGVSPFVTPGLELSNFSPSLPQRNGGVAITMSWLGANIDVPAGVPPGAATQYDVYAWCVSQYGIPSTATVSTTISVSVAAAQAYLGGSPTTPVSLGTLTSAVPYYSLSADGTEQWQLQITGSVPNDPTVQNEAAILCPMFVFAGYNGSVGASLPSESGSYAGGSINVYVKPWFQPGLTCTVAGLTGTNYAAATFTISGGTIAPGLNNNYCLINNLLCHIPANGWLTKTTFMIDNVQGGTLGNGTFAFAGQEARYGVSSGDTLSNGQETFTLTGYQSGFGSLDFLTFGGGEWVSGWVLQRTSGAHPTSAAGTIWVDIAGQNTDIYAGTLSQGQTSGVSNQYPIGSPTAYVCYLVSLSSLNTLNPWPLLGVTPAAIVGTVEVQTTGSVAMNRALASTLGPGFSGGSGNPIQSAQVNADNQANNPSFELLPLGNNWGFSSAAVIAVAGALPTITSHTGLNVAKLSPPGSGNTALVQSLTPIVVVPGRIYTMSVWAACSAVAPNGTLSLLVLYQLNGVPAATPSFQGPPITPNSSAWTQWSITFTIPAGVNQLVLTPGYWQNGTTGFCYIDDVLCEQAPVTSTTGGLLVNANGELGANVGSSLGVNGFNELIIPANSLTVTSGLFPSGTGSIIGGFWAAATGPTLPNSQYPSGSWFFNTFNGRAYYNKSGVWIDKGDPTDMIAGQLDAGVVYAGAIGCAQLTAGTITVAVTLTSPTLVISGGAFTINIDTSNGIRLNNTANTSQVSLVSGWVDITSGSFLGFCSSNTLSVTYGTFTTTAAMAITSSSANINLVAPSQSFQVQLASAGGWIQINSTALDPFAPPGSITYVSGVWYRKGTGAWASF